MIDTLLCDITYLKSKKKIYKLFGIPEYARCDSFDFSKCYVSEYLKKDQKNKKLTKEEQAENRRKRIDSYTNINNEKKTVHITEKPEDYSPSKYRVIVKHVLPDYDWLKRAQKKLHKILMKGLPDITYLHSTTRKKSYATNGLEHTGDSKYMFVLDISGFFTQIDIERVQSTFYNMLKIDNDVATLYSKLTTTYNEEHKRFELGQGLPTSSILSYLCYKDMFDYLYTYSSEQDVKMSVYVDDIAFSSAKKISQKFINKIIGVLKENGLRLKRSKVHNYQKSSTKKITGVYIKNGNPEISIKKKEEMYYQYMRIVELINDCSSIDTFLTMHQLFTRFMGNYMHLCQVEYRDFGVALDGKKGISLSYAKLYNELIKYCKPGTSTQRKHQKFELENFSNKTRLNVERRYMLFQKELPRLRHMFKKSAL